MLGHLFYGLSSAVQKKLFVFLSRVVDSVRTDNKHNVSITLSSHSLTSSGRRTMARVVSSLATIPVPPWPFFASFLGALLKGTTFSVFYYSALSPGDRLRLVVPLSILAENFSCSLYLCFASTVIVTMASLQRVRSLSLLNFRCTSQRFAFPRCLFSLAHVSPRSVTFFTVLIGNVLYFYRINW